MLSDDNDESNHQGDSGNLKILQARKEAAPDRMKENNKSNKIKILSQTLLKAANLTSRKEILNKALGNTSIKIDKLVVVSPVASTNVRKNDDKIGKNGQISVSLQSRGDNTSDESDVSNSNSGQGKFIRGLMKSKQDQAENKELLNSDENGDELNNNRSTDDKKQGKKEELSDSDSSEVFERSIRKTQSKHIVPSKSATTHENKTKSVRIRAKSREVLSSSSDSETDQDSHGEKHDKNLEKQSSSNKDSSLSTAPNKNVTIRKKEKQLVRTKAKEKKPEILSEFSDSKAMTVNRSKDRVGNSVEKAQNRGKPAKIIDNSISSSSGSDNDEKSARTAKESGQSSLSESEADNKKDLSENKRQKSSESSSYDSDCDNNKNDTKSSGSKQNVRRKSSSLDSESSDDNNKKSEVQNRNVKTKRAQIKSDKRNIHSSSSSTSSDSDNDTSSRKIAKRKRRETNSSDESSHETPNKKFKPTKELLESEKLLQSFSEGNNYKRVELKHENPLNALNKHEEVYLVQMSKNINPRCLLNQKISFDNPMKLKIEDETYIWDINGDKQDDAILINGKDLLHLKPKGIVNVQPHFKSKNPNVEMLQPVEDILDVPGNLKVRHPLFGISYEEQMKLDDEVMKKLDDIFVDINRRNKKKSKKKRKEVDSAKIEEEQQDDALDIIKLLSQHESRKIEVHVETEPRKNKKKHKHVEGDNEIAVYNQTILSDTISEVKKMKKKKKNKSRDKAENFGDKADPKSEAGEDESEAGTSFIASIIQESSKKKKDRRKLIDDLKEIPNNNLMKKHKKLIEEINEEQPPIVEAISEVPKKKKHRKKGRKDSLSEGIQEESFMKALIDECTGLVNPRKKKKQDKHDEVATNAIENYGETSKKKINKNKLKIANSTMSSSNMGNTILQLDESAIPKAKKKKRKHRDSIDNFIDDLVRDVPSSEETVLMHENKKKKKKKKHKHKEEFLA